MQEKVATMLRIPISESYFKMKPSLESWAFYVNSNCDSCKLYPNLSRMNLVLPILSISQRSDTWFC